MVLIVEGDSDGKAVRALVAPLNVQGVIDWLPANGIGNILRDCRRLIDLARDRIQARGCVAIVIDGTVEASQGTNLIEPLPVSVDAAGFP